MFCNQCDSFERFIEASFPSRKRNAIYYLKPLNPSNIFAEYNPEETTVLLYWPGNI